MEQDNLYNQIVFAQPIANSLAQTERYYETLKLSSQGWQEGKHEPWTYINFLLYTLIDAYKEFEQQITGLNAQLEVMQKQVQDPATPAAKKDEVAATIKQKQREIQDKREDAQKVLAFHHQERPRLGVPHARGSLRQCVLRGIGDGCFGHDL